jgi:hypothetical protein
MGYAVQDDEKIELNSSLAAEVITSVIIWSVQPNVTWVEK